MISTNGRLPAPSVPSGTASATQPSTAVTAIIPAIRMSRPRAERMRYRIPSAPIA